MKYRYPALIIFVCMFLMFGIIHRFPGAPNPSEYSRLYQIRSLVENKTLAIDAMITRYGHVMDKSIYNGRFYSDKAFGITLLCTPFYWLYFILFGPASDNEWLKYFLRCLTVVLPAVLFIYMICKTYIAPDNKSAFRTLIGVVIGTIFFTYSTMLYSHTVTASAAGIAWCIIDSRCTLLTPIRLAAIGGLCGLCVILEYPAILLAAWLLLYAVSRLIRNNRFTVSRCAVLLFAFSLPIALQMYVNYLSFGSPFSTGYAHKAAVSQMYYHAEGLSGVSIPSWKTLWGILFSPSRGMFYFSPFLLFAVPSLLKPLKNRWHRIEGIILCGITASYTLFAASVVDWQAGWTAGARYYLPVLPFLLIALLKYPPRFASECPSLKRIATWHEIVFTAFIVWGYIHCFALTLTFPSVPEDFQVPLCDFAVPLIRHGCFTLTLPAMLGVVPWASALLMAVAAISLFGFFYLSDKRGILFFISLSMGILLALSSSLLPMDDSAEKHSKFAYLYRFMDRPVDVLGELYLAHRKEPYRIDIHYDLASQLKQLGCYTHSKKHLEHILSKTPTHKPAQKDLIEIDMALRQEFPRYEEFISNPSSISSERIAGYVKVCLFFGNLQSAIELKTRVPLHLQPLIDILSQNELPE